jgi:D-alanyl-lipoteichoic acid acyltransferase DltB (MBOAT superfamily)
MLFHSTTFGVFFVAVFCVFWLLHRRRLPRVLFLLAASYVFYMGWSAKFALLIVFQTVSDYYLGLLLHRLQNERLRTVLLWASVIVNLGILGVFKYYNFFVDSAAQGCAALGLHVSLPALNLLLPVGISFYTFHTLSYTLDVYRRRIEPARNLWEFALAVAFFPQLVAGPITRASQFLPQLEHTPELTLDKLRSGLLLIFRGLFKKILIADVLAETLVDRAYADPALASGRHLLLATYGYAFQIYGDFSGYTDIALGAARCLGYELPVNFDLPYRATSIRDFWRRWHISLSTFLRDYLYIPLGGNRGGTLRTCCNLMITLVLAGLWHGAAWNFVLFGVYHGCLLCGEMLWRGRQRPLTPDPSPLSTGARGESKLRLAPPPPQTEFEEVRSQTGVWERGGQGLRRVGQVLLTFHVLCIGLVIFRAQSVADIGLIFQRIVTWADAPVSGVFMQERGLWVLVLAAALHYVPQSWSASAFAWLESRHPVLQGGLAVGALGALAVCFSAQHPFVYFQF